MRLWPRRTGTSYDLLVAGLGNPGREHAANRHNVGWLVVDELARRHGGQWRAKFNGRLAEVRIDGHKVALLSPARCAIGRCYVTFGTTRAPRASILT